MNNFCGYHNQLKSELEHLIGQNNFSIEQYKFLLHLTYEILKEFEFSRLQVGLFFEAQKIDADYVFFVDSIDVGFDDLNDYIGSVFLTSNFVNKTKLIVRHDDEIKKIVEEFFDVANTALIQEAEDSDLRHIFKIVNPIKSD